MSTLVYLITGSSRGIGAALSRSLLASKKSIIVIGIGRSAKPNHEISNECIFHTMTSETINSISIPENPDDGKKYYYYYSGDVTNHHHMETLSEWIKNTFNRIDGLVCNAGTVTPMSRIETCNFSMIQETKKLFDINFFSVVYLVHLLLPILRITTPTRVVFISSGITNNPSSGTWSYSCSKAALNMFVPILDKEEIKNGIECIGIHPGILNTDAARQFSHKGSSCFDSEHFSWFEQALSDAPNPDADPYSIPVVRCIVSLLLNGIPSSYQGKVVNWNDLSNIY